MAGWSIYQGFLSPSLLIIAAAEKSYHGFMHSADREANFCMLRGTFVELDRDNGCLTGFFGVV